MINTRARARARAHTDVRNYSREPQSQWHPQEGGQNQKASSTLKSSRAVPHPSTNRALRRLTSEFGRDPVHSTRYGRWQYIVFEEILGQHTNLILKPSSLPNQHATNIQYPILQISCRKYPQTYFHPQPDEGKMTSKVTNNFDICGRWRTEMLRLRACRCYGVEREITWSLLWGAMGAAEWQLQANPTAEVPLSGDLNMP